MENIKFYAVVQQFDPDSQNTFYKVAALKLINIESNELNPIFFKTISDSGLIYTIHPSEFGNQVFLNLSEAFSACDKKNNELAEELAKVEYAMSHAEYEYVTKDSETTRELFCGVDLVRSFAYWMTTVEYAKRHNARPSGFGGGHVYCSNCEKMSDEKTAYCPNCGRVMSNVLSKSADPIDPQNLSDATTQEVKPVVRAKWKFRSCGRATCSNCGFTFSSVYDDDSCDKYCRKCGAEISI